MVSRKTVLSCRDGVFATCRLIAPGARFVEAVALRDTNLDAHDGNSELQLFSIRACASSCALEKECFTQPHWKKQIMNEFGLEKGIQGQAPGVSNMALVWLDNHVSKSIFMFRTSLFPLFSVQEDFNS